MVPIQEVRKFIGDLFPTHITSVFQGSFVQWNGSVYEHINGVAMGSPLSPVVPNVYMKKSEELAMRSALLKSKCWY